MPAHGLQASRRERGANISGCPIQRQPENRRVGNSLPTLLAEKQNSLVSCQVIFCWLDWLSGCLTLHNCLMLLSIPLRPAERSILFSETSVRLSDGARSATSSHAPKKGCGVREVWRSQTCTSGSPFFCLLFFGEAKKSKCPVGMRRMVKATPKANHKAPTHFQAAFVFQPKAA